MIKNKYDSTTYIVKRVIYEYILPYKVQVISAIFFMIISSLAVSARAYLMKPAIDKIFINKNLKALYIIPIAILFVAVINSFASYLQGLIMEKLNLRIELKLKKQLFEKLIYKDIGFYNANSVSKITSLFGDINSIIEIVNVVLSRLILQTITLTSLIILMFYQNWKLSIISFVAFPILIFPLRKITKKMRSLSSKNRDKGLGLVSTMGEAFENITIVKSNNTEQKEIDKIDEELNFLFKTQKKIVKKALIVSPMIEMIGTIGFGGVILYGGACVIKGVSSTGDFFTFIASLFSAYKPAKSFTGLGVKLQNAFVSAKRLFMLLDDKNRIIEGTENIEHVQGDIVFKNVNFTYPEEVVVIEDKANVEKENPQVLFNLNLNMEHNKSYALVGHSGSGKSTIFNLILRFYDVTSGDIFIGGHNIKDFNFPSLRKHISLVSQDVKLFDTSIYNNILYANVNATEEEVYKAAKLANVDEFARQLPDGYNTVIGPNGSLLSGGQRQRISIARAFLKNSQILLLDEATSALDPVSENLVKESIHTLMEGKTTIIIAHRLSTIINCDHIFVFEHGHLMEQGKHQELLAKNGVYTDLYNKQFGSHEN